MTVNSLLCLRIIRFCKLKWIEILFSSEITVGFFPFQQSGSYRFVCNKIFCC